MKTKPTLITELDHRKAFGFLMDSSQYSTIQLPGYFNFSPVLRYASEAVGDMSLGECLRPGFSAMPENLNLVIRTNKDGGYGIRHLTFINPFLYAMLVRTICEPEAWQAIQRCFGAFSSPCISACSIPVWYDVNLPQAFHGSNVILNWWRKMEQKSLSLSLNYRYMFMSDISDCFGQIDHNIFRDALARTGTSRATDANDGLASHIIALIRAIQGGRNTGIPQGSLLTSFLAEIILGYADLLLEEAVRANGIGDDEYHVLRYVDDYRIFCNDRNTLEKISFLLQEVLDRLNFRLNCSKTRISDNIIRDAVKPDKAFYIFNTPIVSNTKTDFNGFQKHLYFIFEFGRRYPNCGQLKVQLSQFNTRLREWLEASDLSGQPIFTLGEELLETLNKKGDAPAGTDSDSGTDSKGAAPSAPDGIFSRLKKYKRTLHEDITPMIAIAVQIGIENITAAHYALLVVSRLLKCVPDMAERKELAAMVYRKMRRLPNSSYLQLWLQNITYFYDDKEINGYDMPLCALIHPDGHPELWDNSWIRDDLADGLPTADILDKDSLERTESLISIPETSAYDFDCDFDIDIPEGLDEYLTSLEEGE